MAVKEDQQILAGFHLALCYKYPTGLLGRRSGVEGSFVYKLSR